MLTLFSRRIFQEGRSEMQAREWRWRSGSGTVQVQVQVQPARQLETWTLGSWKLGGWNTRKRESGGEQRILRSLQLAMQNDTRNPWPFRVRLQASRKLKKLQAYRPGQLVPEAPLTSPLTGQKGCIARKKLLCLATKIRGCRRHRPPSPMQGLTDMFNWPTPK
jgi:hypothetical protein